MANKDFSRIEWSTFEPDKTKDSYESVLAFRMARFDASKAKEDGDDRI
jgi:hypothetical protein